jgi:Flp pilus assembly protein TadG
MPLALTDAGTVKTHRCSCRPTMSRLPTAQRRTRMRGQSLVEFAIVLPIMLGLMGGILDYSRFNEQRLKLESATRDAAEFVARDKTVTNATLALPVAQRVICLQFGLSATCVPPPSDPSRPVPNVTIPAWSACTTNDATCPGGSGASPRVTVGVAGSVEFQTLFPYPFLTDRGATTLAAAAEFKILQGRGE